MYGYEEYIDITPQQLLQKVSQEQIFQLALDEQFSYSTRYVSPFREDSRAGCRFEDLTSGVMWVDYGDRPTHRGCFKFLMDRLGLDMLGAIRYICVQYGLSTSSTDYEQPLTYNNCDLPLPQKAEIFYYKKEFTVRDARFWAGSITTLENLKEDKVYSVSRVLIDNKAKRKKSNFTPFGLCYAIDFVDAVKIYQPYNHAYKWITNCDADHVGNIDNLPSEGDTLIITKAYKDHRIFRNIGLGHNYYCIWFQNEGQFPNYSILYNLVTRFRRIVIFFDNDKAGILAAIKLAEILNEIRAGCAFIKHTPYEHPSKDVGEYLLREGRRDTLMMLNQIRL